MNANPKAGVISRNHPYIQAAVEAIIARAWAVGDAKTRDLVKQELEAKLNYWLEQATNSVGGSVLGYQTQKDGLTVGLLKQPEQGGRQPFT